MNHKLLKIGLSAIGILAVVSFFLLAFVHKQNSVVVSQNYAVPSAFTAAVDYGNTSLVLPTYQGIVTYNYQAGVATPLTPTQDISNFSNIDNLSVSADKQYLLFHDDIAPVGSILSTVLTQQGLDTARDYWWLYDVASQAFIPVPGNPVLAKFDGNNIDALVAQKPGEAIVKYSPSFYQLSTIPVVGTSNFFPVSGGFLLQTPDNNVLFTTDGVVNQLRYRSTVLVGVTADLRYAVATMKQGNAQQLIVIDLPKNSSRVVAKNIVDAPVLSKAGTVLYSVPTSPTASKPPTLHTYALQTNRDTVWKISGLSSNVKPVAIFANNTAVISTGQTSNYLVGNQLAPVPTNIIDPRVNSSGGT